VAMDGWELCGVGGPNCTVEACDMHTIARTCYICCVQEPGG
jgi:hypothetical protein